MATTGLKSLYAGSVSSSWTDPAYGYVDFSSTQQRSIGLGDSSTIPLPVQVTADVISPVKQQSIGTGLNGINSFATTDLQYTTGTPVQISFVKNQINTNTAFIGLVDHGGKSQT